MDKQGKSELKNECKNYLSKFKIGTIQMFKDLCKKKTRKKQIANSLSFTRLLTPFITIILSTIALVTNILPLFTIAGIITILGGCTDFFDGMVARKTNSTSEYGKLLDQITDKVFAILLGIDLAIINPLFIIPILGESFIAAINLKYKLNHKDLAHKSTLIGRIKEFPLFLTLGLGYFCPVNSICLNIVKLLLPLTFALQSATAVSYIIKNEKEIKNQKTSNNLSNIRLEENLDTDEKNTNKKEKEKSKTSKRIEQYKELKRLLEETKTEEKEINKTYQKIK